MSIALMVLAFLIALTIDVKGKAAVISQSIVVVILCAIATLVYLRQQGLL